MPAINGSVTPGVVGDLTKAVDESLYEECKEPIYAPVALLARMALAGQLDHMTGRGFYHH